MLCLIWRQKMAKNEENGNFTPKFRKNTNFFTKRNLCNQNNVILLKIKFPCPLPRIFNLDLTWITASALVTKK